MDAKRGTGPTRSSHRRSERASIEEEDDDEDEDEGLGRRRQVASTMPDAKILSILTILRPIS
jgi:hypothetical protein